MARDVHPWALGLGWGGASGSGNWAPFSESERNMPRANKAVKRQRESAAQAYKKGNKEEAYKLWGAAAKTQKELRDKKRNKKSQGEAAS